MAKVPYFIGPMGPGLGRGARGSIGAARDAFGAPQRIIFGTNGSDPSQTNEIKIFLNGA